MNCLIKRFFFGTFPSEVRPEFVTEESVELVRKYCANDSLSLGAQSGSGRILKEIRRGHTVEDSISAVECCLEHEIVPAVDFIFGLPTETEEDQEKKALSLSAGSAERAGLSGLII